MNKPTTYENEAYDDTYARELTLKIMSDLHVDLCVNGRYSTADFDSQSALYETKRIHKPLAYFQKLGFIGINEYSYQKYKKLSEDENKDFFVIFLLTDYYILFNINAASFTKEITVNDRAHGTVTKTMRNFDLNNAIKINKY
jgi:hypothetical protein